VPSWCACVVMPEEEKKGPAIGGRAGPADFRWDGETAGQLLWLGAAQTAFFGRRGWGGVRGVARVQLLITTQG